MKIVPWERYPKELDNLTSLGEKDLPILRGELLVVLPISSLSSLNPLRYYEGKVVVVRKSYCNRVGFIKLFAGPRTPGLPNWGWYIHRFARPQQYRSWFDIWIDNAKKRC